MRPAYWQPKNTARNSGDVSATTATLSPALKPRASRRLRRGHRQLTERANRARRYRDRPVMNRNCNRFRPAPRSREPRRASRTRRGSGEDRDCCVRWLAAPPRRCSRGATPADKFSCHKSPLARSRCRAHALRWFFYTAPEAYAATRDTLPVRKLVTAVTRPCKSKRVAECNCIWPQFRQLFSMP